jgi:hypothetical protein
MPTDEWLMSSRDARGAVIKEMIVFCLFIADSLPNNSLTRMCWFASDLPFSAPKQGGLTAVSKRLCCYFVHYLRISEYNAIIHSHRIVKSSKNRFTSVSIESRDRGFESQRPDWLFGPPCFLSNWFRALFTRVKLPEREAYHSPPSSEEVKVNR